MSKALRFSAKHSHHISSIFFDGRSCLPQLKQIHRLRSYHTLLPCTVGCWRIQNHVSGITSTIHYTQHRHVLKPCVTGNRCSSSSARLIQNNVTTPTFMKSESFGSDLAVIDENGRYSYHALNKMATHFSKNLCDHTKGETLNGETVCFLCGNDVSYVVASWAIWRLGGIAVPLCKTHPPPELKYFIEDSKCKKVVCTEDYWNKLQLIGQELGLPLHILSKQHCMPSKDDVCTTHRNQDEPPPIHAVIHNDHQNPEDNQHADDEVLQSTLASDGFRHKPALIIYTSGTTGRPKGVLHTFGSLAAQIDGMAEAWEWSRSDSILHVLPLHHIHGIVNVLLTPLTVGASVVMMPDFKPDKVWNYLLNQHVVNLPRPISVFMAVPTIYSKLLDYFNSRYPENQVSSFARNFAKEYCKANIRLMVSGSAALPVSVMEAWEKVTGHHLLERYGMTEVGMALGNPLRGHRQPGCVGNPFPGVEVQIAKRNTYESSGYDILASGNHEGTTVHTLSGATISKHLTSAAENDKSSQQTSVTRCDAGELMVRGPSLFKEYWCRPEATATEFTKDGWYLTGDTAMYEQGTYRIMGRTSVDIIKSGGFKISALDIEKHLLEHSAIVDVAVLGLPDMTWGQRVAAVIVLSKSSQSLDVNTLRSWCKTCMPAYYAPSVIRIVDTMPRNAMGKVNKKDLMKDLFSNEMKKII